MTNRYFYVHSGQKIAQALIKNVPPKVEWEMTVDQEMSESSRGSGGFGSTGI
jgi:dUTPase